jgi:hypothetical protein
MDRKAEGTWAYAARGDPPADRPWIKGEGQGVARTCACFDSGPGISNVDSISLISTTPQQRGRSMLKIFVAVTTFLFSTSAWAQAAPAAPPYISLIVAVITGVFGFVGSWLGAQVALMNFKKQRAFDKKLDWYERAANAIYTLSEEIEIACTLEEPPKAKAADLKAAWRLVQQAHLKVDRVSHEAQLYASQGAITQISAIARRVQALADKTEAFDPPLIAAESRADLIEKIYKLSAYLTKAAPPLLAEAREHLGIDKRRLWTSAGTSTETARDKNDDNT